MPVYSWEGRSANGAVVRGELEAPTRAHALARLKTTGVTVVRVADGRGDGVVVDASSAPPAEPKRKTQGLLRFEHGALAFFTAIGIGVGYVSPVLDYDCTRDAGGAVDCAVHRRVFGLVPRSTLLFRGIRTVQLVIGGYSQSMAEQMRQVSNSTRSQSWDALEIVTADGSSWQSHQSSSPMGQTNVDLVNGIDGLLNSDAPAAYHGWTIAGGVASSADS